MFRAALLCCFLLALSACASERDDGVTDIAFMGATQNLQPEGVRLSYAQAHVRAATAQGLVTLDAEGQVIPAIAERWIVTDDGESYIFRLRDIETGEGERLSARSVRNALVEATRRLEGTSVGRDLDKIRDIRAMTGRVVEIRLRSPMPGLLQLLAQPELALRLPGFEVGPMQAAEGEGGTLALDARSPQARGLPEQPGWEEQVRPLRVYAVPPEDAARGFYEGAYDIVLGGTVANLPLADTGPLTRGTLRVYSATGLFGLDVRKGNGFLASPETREALSAAIDRDALMEPFNLGGWTPTTRFVPPTLYSGTQPDERWDPDDMEQRRSALRQAATRWTNENGSPPRLALFLPAGPGSDILFAEFRQQMDGVGIALERADSFADADLALRDRTARYASPRWFLNQFACTVRRTMCDENADLLVDLASETPDADEQNSYLLEAETVLLAQNRFIPLGQPIRWALVRSGVDGFVENAWGLHPLFPFSRAPI